MSTPTHKRNINITRITEYTDADRTSFFHTKPVSCITYSTSHDILYTGSGDGYIFIRTFKYLNPSVQRPPSTRILAHEGCVVFLQVIPGKCELLVSIGAEGDVKLWEFQKTSIAHLKTMTGYCSIVDPCILLSTSPIPETGRTSGDSASRTAKLVNSRYLIFASKDSALNLWNLDNNTCFTLEIYDPDLSMITEIAVCGQLNLLAIGTESGEVKLFEMSTFTEVLELQTTGVITNLTFAGEADATGGYMLAAAASNPTGSELHIWRFLNCVCSPVYSHSEAAAVQEIWPLDGNVFFISYTNSAFATVDVHSQTQLKHQVTETYQEPLEYPNIISSLIIPIYEPRWSLFVRGFMNSEVQVSSLEHQVRRNGNETKNPTTGGERNASLTSWTLTAWKQTEGPKLDSTPRDHVADDRALQAAIDKVSKPINQRDPSGSPPPLEWLSRHPSTATHTSTISSDDPMSLDPSQGRVSVAILEAGIHQAAITQDITVQRTIECIVPTDGQPTDISRIVENLNRHTIGQPRATEKPPSSYDIVPIGGGNGLTPGVHTELIQKVMAQHPETPASTYRIDENHNSLLQVSLLLGSDVRNFSRSLHGRGQSRDCKAMMIAEGQGYLGEMKVVDTHSGASEEVGSADPQESYPPTSKDIEWGRAQAMADMRSRRARKITVEKLSVSMHKPQIYKPSSGRRDGGGGGKKLRAVGGVGAMIESVVENFGRAPYADATDTPDAGAGTYRTRSTVGVYARATTLEANAGYSILEATALGPNAAVGVHAGPSGVTVYAKAELLRAEASAGGLVIGGGLNVNSGASIGVDGLDVSIFGFGVSIGPRMAVRLPILDISCIIM